MNTRRRRIRGSGGSRPGRRQPGAPALRGACLLAAFLLALAFPLVAAAGGWNPGATLKAYILGHYPWPEVDVSNVELTSAPPSHAPVSIFVEKAPPGKAVFRLTFKGDRTLLATAQVKAFDRVFMSRSSFSRGYVLGPDDLYPALMETSRIPRGALRTAEQAVGNPLLRSVVPNAPLTNAMVSDAPLVKRGRRVVLLVDAPGFTIKAMGETRQDAAVGAFVKAENLMSKKIVTGLLVDENTVRVEY